MANLTVAQAQAYNNTLSDAFHLSYNQAVSQANNWGVRLAKTVPTNTKEVNFPFLLQSMGIKETDIGVSPDYLDTDAILVQYALKKWGNAARIPIIEFENPLYQSMLMDNVQSLASELAYFPTIKACDILNNGDTSSYLAYDGQNFFSNSHVLPNGQSFDNLLNTNPLGTTGITAALDALDSVKYGPYGRVLPLGGQKDVLVVPTGLRYTAEALIRNSQVYLATFNSENPYQGAVDEVIVDNHLTNNGSWYVLRFYQNIFPLIHIEHTKEVRQFIALISPENVNVYEQDNYQWVAKSFENYVPGQFPLAVKCLTS